MLPKSVLWYLLLIHQVWEAILRAKIPTNDWYSSRQLLFRPRARKLPVQILLRHCPIDRRCFHLIHDASPWRHPTPAD